ncbi:TPA: hypothetical protein ACH3X2_009741 [Trebouxia sp. C0005]
MTESIEPDLQDDAGFAIPAQHARKARIRQKRIEHQQGFRFRQPPAERRKNGAGDIVLFNKQWQKGAPQKTEIGKLDQVPKAEPQNWSTFLSSLQASQQPAVHNWAANEPVDHDWAGTVYWNGVWDKALDAEAKVVHERQQAVLEEESSGPSQPAAAPTTVPDAPRGHSPQALRMAPVPLNTGLLLSGCLAD